MRCLLLDVGSTFIKYEIYDDAANCALETGKMPFPDSCLCDGVVFRVSSEDIRFAIEGIFELGARRGCKRAYISVQMHGYLVKKTDGEISDYVSWRDRSGDITDGALCDMDMDLFGTSLKDNLPLAKLICAEDAAEFFTLGSYISWMLTHNNATHVTDGCASGFFYSDSGKYNGALKNTAMPTVHTDIAVVGYRGEMAVYTPMGDHQVSFLGSGAGEQAYLLNIGTASQISCVAEAGMSVGECEKRPYFDGGVRLYTVSGLVGGDMLYCGKGSEKLFEQVEEAVGHLPKKSGVYLGGGGAAQIYEALKHRLGSRGIDCTLLEKNIGTEGLEMIAKEHRIKVGTMLSEVPFVNFPIIAKNSGLDFMMIDCEHGSFDMSVLSALLMNSNLIGLDTVIRLPDNSRENIIRFADMGCRGFLLPMTDAREDIEAVVKYAKYSPIGKRGISTTRAHTLYDPPSLAKYKVTANERMHVYAQIETAAGVCNIEDIMSVDGVDGVFVGPNDLSDDIGCLGDKKPIFECIDKVSEAAKKAGKMWGVITADAELISYARECGVGSVSCGSELNMLINGCKKLKEMF